MNRIKMIVLVLIGIAIGGILPVAQSQDYYGMDSDGTSFQLHQTAPGRYQWMDSTGRSGQVHQDPSQMYIPRNPC